MTEQECVLDKKLNVLNYMAKITRVKYDRDESDTLDVFVEMSKNLHEAIKSVAVKGEPVPFSWGYQTFKRVKIKQWVISSLGSSGALLFVPEFVNTGKAVFKLKNTNELSNLIYEIKDAIARFGEAIARTDNIDVTINVEIKKVVVKTDGDA